MKKIFTTIAILATLTTVTKAQYKSVLLYGTAGYTNKPTSPYLSSRGYFAPGIGYQFSNELTAGINLSLVGTVSGKGTSNEVNSSEFGVGPFLRYTRPLNNYFGLFAQTNVSILNYSSEGESYASGLNANIQPAAYINLKNGFALYFTFGTLGYNSTKAKGATESDNGFDLDFGQAYGFGMSKNFAAKVRK